MSTLASSVSFADDLTTTQKLYNHIYQGHLFDYKDHRFIGSWKTNVYFKQSFNLLSLEENSFFVPIFIMQTLDDLNKTHPLDNFEKLKANFKTYVDGFLDEAIANQEPSGTINYWRSYPTANGPHYYPKDPREFNVVESLVLNLRNIPNDLDGAAQMCDWLLRTDHDSASQYCSDFIYQLSSDRYVDTLDKPQSVFDDKWKSNGSGAFLTWASSDPDRLPYNANDVDCAVNLNILNAFNSISENYSRAAIDPVVHHLDNVCKMIQDVVINDKAKKCSPYYDESGFYWAFSKGYKNELTKLCFNRVAPQVKKKLFATANKLNSQIKRGFYSGKLYFNKGVDTIDVLETIVAMYNMKMHEDPNYSLKSKYLMKRFLNIILVNSKRTPNSIAIPEGFAFRGIIHLYKNSGRGELTGLWKSSYLANVLALEAYLNFQDI